MLTLKLLIVRVHMCIVKILNLDIQLLTNYQSVHITYFIILHANNLNYTIRGGETGSMYVHVC